MFNRMRKTISKAINPRIITLLVVFILLTALLVQRLFQLQIVDGESYQNDHSLSIIRERTLASSRGNIYDRNGEPIAYNELSQCVTFENNGTYSSTKEQNLTINGILYNVIKIIEEQGDSIVDDFEVTLNEDGSYSYNVSGFTQQRFLADLFGEASISSLSDEQLNISADELMDMLCGSDYYGILDPSVTAQEKAEYGLPESFTDLEVYQLVSLRAEIATYSFQRYQTVTIARNVSDETVARILENQANFPGIDISEEYLRVYANAEYMAPLIGYTGLISADELEELQEEDSSYTATDIVGKSGLEQIMETTLQGDKGYEEIYVDNMGRTQEVISRTEPQAGNDLYLTIDMNLQAAAYQILEQYIAGILYVNIVDTREWEATGSADDVRIPIYDVYYALFENNVLDVSHLKSNDASENEQAVYNAFLVKASNIFSTIRSQLLSDEPPVYSELTEEYQMYVTYIVDNMLTEGTGLLNADAIDTTDATYQAWEAGEISLQEYLTYAISQNWLDVTGLTEDAQYLDSSEVFSALSDYIADYLYDDDDFCKQVYRYMLEEDSITGSQVCLLLFDQGVLEMDTDAYERLQSGSLSGYDFIREKIYNLEITPAQLALNPCSGAIVITDPNNGETLACVTYPGYDNNRLANDMDTDYFYKLSIDLSSPFYSRATQESIAPGSTFKIVAATAGVMEGAIGINDGVYCNGTFDQVAQEIDCTGIHGTETLVTAIRDSCNVYFNTIGYTLSQVNGEYDDDTGLEILRRYASMYGFDSTSGLEVPESAPHISDNDAVRSSMGQATNAYTVSQLARYVSTIANSGTCYDLTLIDRITDSAGSVQEEQEASVHSQMNLPDELWTAIHDGMRAVAQNHSQLRDFTGVTISGKTGTAQETTDKPNHGAFIGYTTPDDGEQQIAIAVRIANGYTSVHAAAVARDVISYYYGIQDESELITGHAADVTSDNTRTD